MDTNEPRRIMEVFYKRGVYRFKKLGTKQREIFLDEVVRAGEIYTSPGAWCEGELQKRTRHKRFGDKDFAAR